MSWPRRLPPFLWGAATSSHQIEGQQKNDWTVWEESGHGKEPSGRAGDHWNRWRDDLALFASLSLNSYRFSLEWSRIEPEPGSFNKAALAQYRAMIETMKSLKMMPLMTLHHFTLPTWIAERGGFLHPQSHTWFARYTEVVMDSLGDLIECYVTINEPLVFVIMGYLIAMWPPGSTGFGRALRLINRLADAHRASYHVIKQRRPDSLVGLAHHLIAFHPWQKTPWDEATTRFVRYMMNKRFIRKIGKEQDFLGVNYYTRQYAHITRGLHPIQSRPATPRTDMDWEIYPQGLLEVLKDLDSYRKPILITENGIATNDDRLRESFLVQHLKVVAQAQQEGFDVRGYFHWSALDNFEWAEGFGPRFGLIDINYDTYARTIRPSALRYRHIIEANRNAFPITVPSR